MNGNTQINTFTGGMHMDIDYSLLKDNQYIYAENVRVVTNTDNSFGVAQTIEGFDMVHPSILLNPGEVIIHTDIIRDYGVVFTEYQGLNRIYRYDFSQSDLEPQTHLVVNLDLDIAKPISSVCRWESADNVKVYWADGVHQIRVVNIAPSQDDYNERLQPNEVDIVPNSILSSLDFVGYGAGSLDSGKIQYAYQLFNVRGTATGVSPLTELIRLSRNDQSNPTVLGTAANINSGKSVKLQAVLPDTSFTHARLISIHYFSRNELPVIKVVDEFQLTNGALYYEDNGNSVLSEMTIPEFNALVSYTFSPKVLETKDNILFAANTKESTWDIAYEARAYRCNSNGEIFLKSNTGDNRMFHANDIDTYEVPEDHDCINPYNTDPFQSYVYQLSSTGVPVLGGKGKNVSYRFACTKFIEDNTAVDVSGRLENNRSLNSITANIDSMYLYDPANINTVIGTAALPELTRYSLSYGDPTMDNLFRGYHREEVYRFGIVLYNEKNIASSVHWIADIKMPTSYETPSFNSGVRVDLTNGYSYDNVALVTFPMGLIFEVKNLPEEVTGFEIVRCERTLADKSIVSQGVISRLAREVGISTNSSLVQSNILRPYPFMTYNDPQYVWYHTADSLNDSETEDTHLFDNIWYIFGIAHTSVEDIFNFASPEVAVNRENIDAAIGNVTGLQEVRRLFSAFTPTDVDTSADFVARTFANQSTVTMNEIDGAVWRLPSFVDTTSSIALISNSDDPDAREYTGPSETLAKYYKNLWHSNTTIDIQEIKYSAALDWNQNDDDIAMSNGVSIGGFTYINTTGPWLKNGNINPGDYKRGLYGPTLLLKVADTTFLPTMDKLTLSDFYKDHIASSVVLCNLRKPSAFYGGESYSNRQNSTYISLGNHVLKGDATTHEVICFGGDTYIGVFDYALSTQYFKSDDYNADKHNKHVHSIYVPVETSINLLMRTDEFRMSRNYNQYMQNNITAIGNLYSQNKPMYAYNDVYSLEQQAKKYVTKGLYNIDDLHTDARVIHSQPKTDNEVSDSWTQFKVANFLDVDNQYGSINNLVNFKNTLFFWQTDAFGTLAVNERSLISDNNPGSLTLGTGDILARYDYISNKNGLKQDYLRSIAKSDSALYWYDYDRSEVCGFQGDIQTVSKLKGVQSYLNGQRDTFKVNPNVVYDKKYNEALLTLDNKTLSFNEQVGAFTSFYTISPDWYFEFTDKLYTFKDNKLFKYNAGDTKNLYGTDDKWTKLVMVVNKDYVNTKTFDNVQYAGDFTWGTNLTNIVFNTKRQESFVTTMDKIDYREDTYKFAIPRSNREFNEIQELVNKSYRDRMKGKYMVATYYYNNNGGNTFKLPYVSTLYRYSMI